MKLIVALGNPGTEYLKTRHNAGFIIADLLAAKYNFPDFKLEKKFNAQLSEGIINGEKFIIAKPQTFMNRSGQSARALLDYYKLSNSDLIVIHDDLDIDLGTCKISEDSSAGGHNGVQSMIDQLGTQRFKRMRIGIEGAAKKQLREIPGQVFVLANFTQEEFETIKQLADQINL